MALPKLNAPRYKMKLPSDGRTVNFRPFLVKEEKSLLIATETGDSSTMINAIKDIIRGCTDIKDVEELATFDIEYVFLQVRTKSVGESVDVSVVCPDDEETEVEVNIPLEDIKVQKTKGHKKELKLDDGIMVTMKYPSLENFVEMNFAGEQPGVDQVFKMAAGCIEQIATEEEVHDCTSLPEPEMLEFLDQLTSAQFKAIQDFFETMPKLAHTLNVKNPKTGKTGEVKLEGLAAFFG